MAAVRGPAALAAIWKDGFKPGTGEHEVLLAAAALALTETGPGVPSLDSALGLERSGTGWTLAALAGGAVGSKVAIEMGRRQPAAPATTEAPTPPRSEGEGADAGPA